MAVHRVQVWDGGRMEQEDRQEQRNTAKDYMISSWLNFYWCLIAVMMLT